MFNHAKKRSLALALAMAVSLVAGALAPAVPTQAAKGTTIDNVKDYYAVSSNVTLNGTGTGWHGKLVYITPESAISYGIQHDEFASAPHTGKDELMVENVYSNDPGMQRYDWLGITLNPGQTYTLMMTLNKNGDATVYLDGKALKSYHNDGLKSYTGSDIKKYQANPQARVEGAGRKNGDTVDVRFSNICVKEDKYRSTQKSPSTNVHAPGKYNFFLPQKTISNPTLHVTQKKNSVQVSGSISGLPGGMDWDSAYEDVSGMVQYIRNVPYFPPKGHKDRK